MMTANNQNIQGLPEEYAKMTIEESPDWEDPQTTLSKVIIDMIDGPVELDWHIIPVSYTREAGQLASYIECSLIVAKSQRKETALLLRYQADEVVKFLKTFMERLQTFKGQEK